MQGVAVIDEPFGELELEMAVDSDRGKAREAELARDPDVELQGHARVLTK
jgi:hypothetical protein